MRILHIQPHKKTVKAEYYPTSTVLLSPAIPISFTGYWPQFPDCHCYY